MATDTSPLLPAPVGHSDEISPLCILKRAAIFFLTLAAVFLGLTNSPVYASVAVTWKELNTGPGHRSAWDGCMAFYHRQKGVWDVVSYPSFSAEPQSGWDQYGPDRYFCSVAYKKKWNNAGGIWDTSVFRDGAPVCNPYLMYPDTGEYQCVDPDVVDKYKNAGKACGPVFVGNPIHVGTGNKYQLETDYVGEGPFPLYFRRHYNSDPLGGLRLGSHWRHSFERSVQEVFPGLAVVYREDGRAYFFNDLGGVWTGDTDIQDRLEQIAGGWRYTTTDDQVETYTPGGRLIAVSDAAGRSLILSYDTEGKLKAIQDNLGKQILLTYYTDGITQGLLESITVPGGRTISYSYNETGGQLEFIAYPDGTTRQYHYERADIPELLTGITDERGVRYANFEYDNEGRAIASYHGPETTVLTDRIDGISIGYDAGNTRLITNSRGVMSSYLMATQHSVSLVRDITGPGCAGCGSGNTSWIYDPANNNVLSRTENGLTTQWGGYDANANPGYMIAAAGTAEERRTDYTYDTRYHSKVATITAPSVLSSSDRKVTTHAYDDFGNILSTAITGWAPDVTPLSRITRYQYNGPLHQLSQIDGPRTDVADITTYTYYPDDAAEGDNRGRLKRITGPTGIVQRDNIQYTDTGKVLSETRPNGLVLGYTYYPGNDRLETLTETSSAGNRVTRWAYLPSGEVESITSGDGTLDATTIRFGYDAARRLNRITDGLGNYVEYTLDTEGNRLAENIYNDSGILHKALTRTFDIYNRLDLVARANTSTDSDFAPDGTLERQTDGNGEITGYSYDSLRRLVTLTQDAGGTALATQDTLTQYGYDVADRLMTVTDPNGNATNYVYDDLGNLRSVTSPDTGITQYTYDAAGNVLARTDAKGQVTAYSYDAANRLLSVDAPGTEDDVAYTYDNCINGVGRLCSVSSGGNTTDYSYDTFGNVTAHQGIGYSHDDANRVRTMTYPSGAVVTYRYDAAGQVNQVQLSRGGVTEDLATDIAYLPFGPVTAISYGNGNGLTQTFDDAYRMTAQTIPGVLELTYPLYDGVDNMLQRDDGLTSPASQYYGYDPLHRLETASGDFGGRVYQYDRNGNRTRLDDGVITNYTYESGSNRLLAIGDDDAVLDGNGNILIRGGYDFSYTTQNRLKEVSNAGGVIAAYAYNGLGQRVQKRYPGGAEMHFVYGLEGQLLAEVTADNDALREYIQLNGWPLAMLDHDRDNDGVADTRDNCNGVANGPLLPDRGGYSQRDTDNDGYGNLCDGDLDNDGIVGMNDLSLFAQELFTVSHGNADFDGDGYVSTPDLYLFSRMIFKAPGPSGMNGESGPAALYYIHMDHLGTPVAMTDGAGTMVWKAGYDPFGSATVNDDVDGDGVIIVNNQRFPGQYYDHETGLHYNYYRYYDPGAGRYITSDPIGLGVGLNTFAYVGNNPIKYSDVYGLFRYYGNWCGPDWTGGHGKTWNELTAAEKINVKPPIDGLDECCMTHDKCYATCRDNFLCDEPSRGFCFKGCDRQLYRCGNRSGVGGVKSFLLRNHMRISSPDPGKNDSCCKLQ